MRHPKSTLVFFFSLTIIGILLATQLRVLLLVDEMMDPEFKTYGELNHLNDHFPEKNLAYLVVGPKDGHSDLSKEAICNVRSWLQGLAQTQNNLLEVTSTFGIRNPLVVNNTLTFKQAIPVDCSDPQKDESQTIAAGLKSIREGPWANILTSPSAKEITFLLQFRDTLESPFWLYPTKQKSFEASTILKLQEDFRTKVETRHPEIKSLWGGVASFQAYYKKAYDQANTLNILSLLLVLLLFRFLFGTFRSGFLYIISLVAAVAPVFGGMALTNAPVDVLSNSIGLMVMIAALEDFLFVAFYLQSHKTHWKKGFRRFLVSGFYTTLTTTIGFGSLALADLSILKRFGIWAACGAFFQFITVFYLIPALMQLFPYFQQLCRKPPVYWNWMDTFKNFRLPRAFAVITGIVFLICLFGLDRVVVSDEPTQIFAKDHYTNQTASEFLKSRGWQTNLSLVLKDPDDYKFNKKILDELKKQPSVITVEDRYSVEEFLKRDISEMYHGAIDMAWQSTSASRRLHNSEIYEDRAIIYASTQDIGNTNRLYNWARSVCQDKCFLAGTLVSYSEFGEKVLSSLMSSLFVSLILMSSILLFLCWAKGVETEFAVIASACWGPLALIFYFVAFKVPIFYITSMFASIIIGLAGDNSIQYILTKSKGSPLEGVKDLGNSSILIIISMSILTGILLFSEFAALRKLGILMIAGFILMLIGDVAILRSLSPPRKKEGE